MSTQHKKRFAGITKMEDIPRVLGLAEKMAEALDGLERTAGTAAMQDDPARVAARAVPKEYQEIMRTEVGK